MEDDHKQPSLKERAPIYYTPEDVLIALLSPKLHEVVKEQYGQVTAIEIYNIVDISLMQSTSGQSGSWFEIEILLRIGELDNNLLDLVTFKLTNPNINNVNNNTMSEGKDIKVDLVEYKKIKKKPH
jgi:hypothetical protein